MELWRQCLRFPAPSQRRTKRGARKEASIGSAASLPAALPVPVALLMGTASRRPDCAARRLSLPPLICLGGLSTPPPAPPPNHKFCVNMCVCVYVRVYHDHRTTRTQGRGHSAARPPPGCLSLSCPGVIAGRYRGCHHAVLSVQCSLQRRAQVPSYRHTRRRERRRTGSRQSR